MRMSQHNSMELNQTLEQRQVLSQKMIQSMNLLQLPLAELDQKIEEELSLNPALEYSDGDAEAAGNNEDSVFEGQEYNEPEFQLAGDKEEAIQISDYGSNESDFQTADEFASLYRDTIDEAPARSQNWLEKLSDIHSDILNNIPDEETTLEDHLLEQLSFDLTEELRRMCERIIHSLDGNGRLTESLDDLVKDRSDKEERELVRKALRIVQSFDPRGVGAKNIQECLCLQIPPHFPEKSKEELKNLIEHHLEHLSRNQIPLISKATGFSHEKIKELRAEIMGMNPWPGTNFGRKGAKPVFPDVIVQKREDGSWDIQVVSGRGHGLRVSPYYLELARRKGIDAATKEYLRKHLGSAKWLIEALEQRKSTLARVVDEIVSHQRDFLESGPSHIKPLKLKQIADRLKVNVSTVSRACNDKWMQTPQGVFPLKRFFSGSLVQDKKADEEGETGETIAQAAVMQKVQEIIGNEDKQSPLSDEEIVKKLNAEGIEISRRTVAKYRGILGIPGSHGRRNWI